jgi:hypothetical protein
MPETTTKTKTKAEKLCRPTVCEDPKTGKITLRFGKCNAGERKRIMKRIEAEGLTILPPELDDDE